MQFEQVTEQLPTGFDVLRREARAEAHQFVERLAADWATGEMRFSRPGEALLAVYVEGDLAGIGGLTLDPVVVQALRMRRFYIRPRFRGRGLGRAIASDLLAQAVRRTEIVTLNAAPGSVGFWQAIGFVPEPRMGHSHILTPSAVRQYRS